MSAPALRIGTPARVTKTVEPWGLASPYSLMLDQPRNAREEMTRLSLRFASAMFVNRVDSDEGINSVDAAVSSKLLPVLKLRNIIAFSPSNINV